MFEPLRRHLLILLLGILLPFATFGEPGSIGVVIMHGKGGGPDKHVADLASGLERQGFLVANLDMPWSGRRDYDVAVSGAESEVSAALDGLRKRGAKTVFVSGHSQGGVFAFYYGGSHKVDGLIAIAPGGNVAAANFREKLGEAVELARKLVAEGKGEEKVRLRDFEGSKGLFPVVTTPTIYLTWFDPEGAMNQMRSIAKLPAGLPVLLIAPTQDYPGLRQVKQLTFDALPKTPHTRLYEPDASHLQSPSASLKEIAGWMTSVSAGAAK